jgi:hypothetical protein
MKESSPEIKRERCRLRVTRVDIAMSALTSAFPSNGHSQRSGKQRLQRRAAMIRRHKAAGAAVAIDQTAHHHMLSRGLRDAGRLPVGVGGEAEKQEALRDGQGTGDGCGGWLWHGLPAGSA